MHHEDTVDGQSAGDQLEQVRRVCTDQDIAILGVGGVVAEVGGTVGSDRCQQHLVEHRVSFALCGSSDPHCEHSR